MKVEVETQPNPNSHARYSYVVLRTEGWEQVDFVGRDGKRYKVEGYAVDAQGTKRCPIERCAGFCCRVIPLIGPVGNKCGFHDDDGLCSLQKEGGPSAKPNNCIVWPRTQLDIDTLNAFAEKHGFSQRCPLRVVEVQDG